ncbi:MAG: hypothetical protein HYR84_16730, partial [Planctomycetes bacterium]|nr:hypothetical protein [Planctomycetota bacterium]
MSRKQKITIRPLPDRIAKARKEGRTQQALELARQLVKFEPTEEHRELLRRVTLERGEQLQANGMWRDAATVFQNAVALGGSPEFIGGAAQKLAACGGIAQAFAAIQHVGDPALRQRVAQHAVDAAVAQGAPGKNALPAEYHAGFDLIVQAFGHYEAGRDQEARDLLQGIGLQSPFLEWKVLLRGLMAHQGNDDARALENWTRLDPARLPSRLCAALRAGIDSAFLAAQPPEVQESLRAKVMQQQGLGVAPLLCDLKDLLTRDDLGAAFRSAATIV